MSELINYEVNDSSDSIVVLGDEKASQKISYQLAQDFYNEITGKSEKLVELSNDPFILKMDDIVQLHYRLEQSLEQYKICSFNESYSINYMDDSSERFSSLARLKAHVGARGTAVDEIFISYKILIVLPKTSRPQEYTITLKMASRVAKIEKMREEFGSMPFGIPLFQFENAKTASFSIEYVDISVANALMSVIKGWFGSVEKSKISSAIKLFRKFSYFIPKVTKYSFLFLTAYYVYLSSDKFLSDVNIGHKDAVVFTLFSLFISYVSVRLGVYLGKMIERNVDNIYEQSYITFSGADENFVKNSSVNIRNSKIKAAVQLLSSIVIAIACSMVANRL